MAWFFISRVAAALVAVITLLALTRLLPAEDFARYSIVILSGMIAQQFTFNWIFSSVTRFHSNTEFSGRTVAYGLGAAAGTTLGLGAVLLPLALLLPFDWQEIYLLTLAVAWSAAMHELGLACLRIQKRGPIFASVALLRPILGTSLAIVFVLRGGGYHGAVVALVVGSLVAGIIGIAAAAIRGGVVRPPYAVLRTFFVFGQPLSTVSSGAMLFPLSSQLILASLVGLEQVGYFAASMTLSDRSLTMMMLTLGQTSAASIFYALENETREKLTEVLDRHFSFVLLISAPLLAVLLFANGTMARVFFNQEFAAGAAPYIALLAISAFIHGLQGGFFAFIFEMRRETVLQLCLAAAFLLLHIAVTYAFITATGNFGAAYATIFTAVATTITYAWYGWPLFGRCTLLEPSLQMALALTAAIPFLVAADSIASLPVALVLIGTGLLAMLAVLAMCGYRSLVLVIETVFQARRS